MPRLSPAQGAGAAIAAPSLVAYYRVSTDRQGRSGLGIEAQKAAVAAYAAAAGGRVIHEFEEVESGRKNDRPELAAALAACRAKKAALVVAKLDRLARNARFLLSVAEGAGEAGVAFCDLPQLPPGPMGKFFLTLMAAVAELEAGLISQRTKAALAAARARGRKLGNPNLRSAGAGAARKRQARAKAREVAPLIRAARKAGCETLTEIAQALTARGVRTPGGQEHWRAEQVRRVIAIEGKR
ncbi:MAG TPA: recombinase family protein [Stellaceae bacterium]|nr:recombinase family protein [Stellaceae bacterium]